MPFPMKGDRVHQPTYGTGTVTEVDTRHTVIDFDNHGIRRFVSSMVTLERTTVQAPDAATATAKKRARTRAASADARKAKKAAAAAAEE